MPPNNREVLRKSGQDEKLRLSRSALVAGMVIASGSLTAWLARGPAIEYQRLARKRATAARDVGITDEQWQAIKRGSVNGSGTSGGGQRSRPRAFS